MRKIYSLVLMATMLLMGTNAWATIYVNGALSATPNDLQATINSVAANDTATITLQDAGISLSDVVVINDGRRICLDMGGFTISDAAGKGCFGLLKGTLHLKNGTVNHATAGNGSNVTRSAIFVSGANAEDKNTPWSTLIVDEDAIVTTLNGTAKQYGITLDVLNAGNKASLGNPSYNTGSCAFGVKILIKGTVYGYQRGINVAGNINTDPAIYGEHGVDALYPYIKVYPGAEVYCSAGDGANMMTSGNGGIYAGGYTIMDISGYVHGQTGILVKSGDINLIDATVASDSDNAAGSGNYGGNVAGMGILIASDNSYTGHVEVTVSGNTTVSAGSNNDASAIVDVLSEKTGQENQVDHITITGGTIDGDITLTTGAGANTQVSGGEIEGTVTVNGTEGVAQILASDVHTTTVVDPVTNQTTTIVSAGASAPATVKATFNGFGLATFSAAETVTIPDGMKAYKTDGLSGNVLGLAEISGKIPAGNGVILYKEGATEVDLQVYTGSETVYGLTDNILKPSTAWSANLANVYILHGSELWLYTGNAFKPNKAFLQLTLPAATSAPKRISMIFNQTETPTAVENVETQNVKAVKFVGEDGQLYIRRGEAVYTVQGQVVK